MILIQHEVRYYNSGSTHDYTIRQQRQVFADNDIEGVQKYLDKYSNIEDLKIITI